MLKEVDKECNIKGRIDGNFIYFDENDPLFCSYPDWIGFSRGRAVIKFKADIGDGFGIVVLARTDSDNDNDLLFNLYMKSYRDRGIFKMQAGMYRDGEDGIYFIG